MAQVTIQIGGRNHQLQCRDGEEAQLRRLGELVARYWPTAERASGGASGERTMLFVALMLADALDEAERRPAGEADAALLNRIADRLEEVAAALEERLPTA